MNICDERKEKAVKIVKVVAAVIVADRINPITEKPERMIFATQRGYGNYKDWWEFPGGKIEEGEAPKEALAREIQEELNATADVGEFLGTIEYDYPEFHLSMDCFVCELTEGDLILKEHEAAKWLTKETLRSVKWLPADVTILDRVEHLLG